MNQAYHPKHQDEKVGREAATTALQSDLDALPLSHDTLRSLRLVQVAEWMGLRETEDHENTRVYTLSESSRLTITNEASVRGECFRIEHDDGQCYQGAGAIDFVRCVRASPILDAMYFLYERAYEHGQEPRPRLTEEPDAHQSRQWQWQTERVEDVLSYYQHGGLEARHAAQQITTLLSEDIRFPSQRLLIEAEAYRFLRSQRTSAELMRNVHDIRWPESHYQMNVGEYY